MRSHWLPDSEVVALVSTLSLIPMGKGSSEIPFTLKQLKNMKVAEKKLATKEYLNIEKMNGKQIMEWAESNSHLFTPEPEKIPLLERRAKTKDSNDLQGRVGSIIRAWTGSMKHVFKISEEEYTARHIYARYLRKKYSIDEHRDFFTNERIENKMSGSTNDHLYPMVENRKWTGYHPDDPLNMVLTKCSTNVEKGNKDPEQFLVYCKNREDITYQQYIDRLGYLGEIHPHIIKIEGEKLEHKQQKCKESIDILIESIYE